MYFWKKPLDRNAGIDDKCAQRFRSSRIRVALSLNFRPEKLLCHCADTDAASIIKNDAASVNMALISPCKDRPWRLAIVFSLLTILLSKSLTSMLDIVFASFYQYAIKMIA